MGNNEIETINPLEQGLKHFMSLWHSSIFSIETINPLEQGLKPCYEDA